MESSDIVVGLDIGTTKIACIIGRKNEHGKIEILGTGKSDSAGVTRGVVSNIEKTVQSIRTAVEEAENIAGVKVTHVHVGIAGQHIKSIQHRGLTTREDPENEITQADIDHLIEDMYKLMMEPGEEIIHVLPQEYIVDSEKGIKEPIGMSGIRLEANFHIIIGQIAAAKNIYRCVHKAGLQVDELILEPLASSEAVLSQEEKEAGVALVDIGGGTTDIAIFQDEIIRHTAVIPLGGSVISNDIRQGCSIIQRQAEQLKVKFGSALSSDDQDNDIVCIPGLRGRQPKEISIRNLSSIIQARLEEIIEYAYSEIRNSGYADQLIGGMVLTGGGAQLKHTAQLTEYVTGMSTRVGLPNEHLANPSERAVTSPMYSTGVGLIIKGFELYQKEGIKEGNITTHSEKSRGNFFEKIFAKGKQWFEEDTD